MLFARAYFPYDERRSIRQQIEHEIGEDMRRGHSFWDGDYDPTLTQDPGIRAFEELAPFLPEKEEDLTSTGLPPLSRGGILAGLCALCVAKSYRELAGKIWDEYREEHTRHKLGKRWDRWGCIAIFEGERVGADPEGWPLFTARRLLAIADVRAIAPAPPSAASPSDRI